MSTESREAGLPKRGLSAVKRQNWRDLVDLQISGTIEQLIISEYGIDKHWGGWSWDPRAYYGSEFFLDDEMNTCFVYENAFEIDQHMP